MKDFKCEEHRIKFPNQDALTHHIKEIHFGLKIDDIEKELWVK